MSSFDVHPFGGSADARAGNLSLSHRFRRHADSLVRNRRSPLCAHLMRSAADDIDAGGIVAELFDGVPLPPGSVPQLRLLGALHYLVLSGLTPALGRFYPSVGGPEPIDGVWPVAAEALRGNFVQIKQRLGLSVQTNEPGRSAVLFAALLWLASQYRLPIRLLELGASAGLNLHPDTYCYQSDGKLLGDPRSPVKFNDPWAPPPAIDLPAAARGLRIVVRAGCDRSPLDPANREDRLTLLSYIWPDELERFNRATAALERAANAPAYVAAQTAGDWLPHALSGASEDVLTIVWHSLFRQYVEADEWDMLRKAFADAVEMNPRRRIVWVSMEPSGDHLDDVELTIRLRPEDPGQHLAWCGDHGPPVSWDSSASLS